VADVFVVELFVLLVVVTMGVDELVAVELAV
jgi:hypothetical protein